MTRLELNDLEITYRMADRPDISAVSNASFEIQSGEYFGLVGESGCGKSTVAKALLGGLDANGEIVSGEILYNGEPVHNFSESEFRNKLRWKEIALIPQGSMNSLDPIAKVSDQALEIGHIHTDWNDSKILSRLEELFEIVGIAPSRIHDYAHQFSGGMEQRALIAFSLLLEPSLIIADEPTTALDVIMQDEILAHFDAIKGEDLSMLMITHDMSVVLETCDSMAVMHSGQTAETGYVRDLYDNPRHPYTKLLQEAFPDVRNPDRDLAEIEGHPPELTDDVDYCTFADRCPWARPECSDSPPPLESVDGETGHEVACVRSEQLDLGSRDRD